ncbi:hypothetical protein GCM10027294_19320 [Marinactinospora endophytica]
MTKLRTRPTPMTTVRRVLEEMVLWLFGMTAHRDPATRAALVMPENKEAPVLEGASSSRGERLPSGPRRSPSEGEAGRHADPPLYIGRHRRRRPTATSADTALLRRVLDGSRALEVPADPGVEGGHGPDADDYATQTLVRPYLPPLDQVA